MAPRLAPILAAVGWLCPCSMATSFSASPLVAPSAADWAAPPTLRAALASGTPQTPQKCAALTSWVAFSPASRWSGIAITRA